MLHKGCCSKCTFNLNPRVEALHPEPYTLNPKPKPAVHGGGVVQKDCYSKKIINLNPTLYTLHPTPYTLHPTPYTLHPTPYTLHPNLLYTAVKWYNKKRLLTIDILESQLASELTK